MDGMLLIAAMFIFGLIVAFCYDDKDKEDPE